MAALEAERILMHTAMFGCGWLGGPSCGERCNRGQLMQRYDVVHSMG
jgi:hypothetical protein